MELFRNVSSDPGDDQPNRTDEDIHNDIQAMFKRDDYLKNRDIQVKVTKGIVTLKGSVFTSQSWQQAADLAADVSGVKEIHNELKVEPGPGDSA